MNDNKTVEINYHLMAFSLSICCIGEGYLLVKVRSKQGNEINFLLFS